jgi:hemin uptake protein HemP
MSCPDRNEVCGTPGGHRARPGAVLAGPLVEAEAEIVSARLLQGRREVVIRHSGQRYRLRVTASDKLILTK